MFTIALKSGTSGYYHKEKLDKVITTIERESLPKIGDIIKVKNHKNRKNDLYKVIDIQSRKYKGNSKTEDIFIYVVSYEKLSAFMSLVLRHSPAKFGVSVDDSGFCFIEELKKGIENQVNWKYTTSEMIVEVAKTCEKQRYNIEGEKIKARYGHSFPVIQERGNKELPNFLFHGTTKLALENILGEEEGILPMNRQYVHLSETEDFAGLAAKRRKNPMLLLVDTKKAMEAGVDFFYAGDEVWLSTPIPANCIKDSIEVIY